MGDRTAVASEVGDILDLVPHAGPAPERGAPAPAASRAPAAAPARSPAAMAERAVADGTAETVRETATRLIRMEIAPGARIASARVFARAGRGEEALAVLLADPATFGSPVAAVVLDHVVQIQGLPRPVAALAWHLRRRLREEARRRKAAAAP
ncbi:hypothetical protein GXW74_06050 [Roseomonas eburnea]|uniref:Uncharacterized protein n=1 Tax=Neoroseomonas eburnea TaxID=1346889 RepID=A0A9X9X8K6_9PROT|nr:hypothetical protein [Neoroseomonas eburnea]MBR0680042.1 hypothetical protein [Neoroseomonas eburnea]